MDFELSDEQRGLQDSINRFLDEQYPWQRRREILRSPAGSSPQVWRGLGELGVLGLLIPEEFGGSELGPLETALVMESCGARGLLEPYLASAVIASQLLCQLGSRDLKSTWLPSMVNGDRRVVLAHFEPAARFDRGRVDTRAQRVAGGYRLDGRKGMVEHARSADALLVSARLADSAALALFLMPTSHPGMRVSSYRLLDGRPAGELTLQGVTVTDAACVASDGTQVAEALDRALDAGIAGLCAEAVGAMQALLDATVAYLKSRQQFGRPIGTFQALQHRAVDMLIELEQARSMGLLAALRCAHPDVRERRRALAAAKVVANQAGRFVGQQAIQLHGGIGMTDDLPAGTYFKRLACIEMSLGDTDTHLSWFASNVTCSPAGA